MKTKNLTQDQMGRAIDDGSREVTRHIPLIPEFDRLDFDTLDEAISVTVEHNAEAAFKTWLDFGLSGIVPKITHGNWDMGDWLLCADNNFFDEDGEGKADLRTQAYSQAEIHLHIPKPVLYNMTSFAKAYPPHSRNETLTWTHHKFAMAIGRIKGTSHLPINSGKTNLPSV